MDSVHPYQMDHEGLTCWLRPGAGAGAVELSVAAIGLFACGLLVGGALALSSGLLAYGAGASGLTAIVALALGLRRRATIELRCASRVLTLARLGIGGWGQRPRSLSLIDVYRAVATPGGWLVVETDPGPLQPLWIDARYHTPSYLEAIAVAITEAADRAEGHRGDHPGAEAQAVQRLLEPQRS